MPPREGCRLPVKIGFLPSPVDPISETMACPLRSTGITPQAMPWRLRAGLRSAALVALLGSSVACAQPIELTLAYFVGDQHAMSQWLIRWADNLEKDSGGASH